jgi:DNA-directed RNA polymerase
MVDQPDPLPEILQPLVRGLDQPHLFLALAALAPLLDAIFRGWKRERERDDRSPGMKMALKIGEDLYWRLRQEVKIPKRWSQPDRVHAGDWLLGQALHMDMFGWDEDGFPCISDKWLPDVAQLREYLIGKNPSYAPLLKPPPPWAGWSKTCDGFEAKFVRDWRPETQTAINAAFLNPAFEHARGVNALAAVPLTIDADMVDLVEQFAVKLMDNDDAEIAELCAAADAANADGEARRRVARALAKRRADQTTVAADVADAKWCIEHGPTIWNDYNCDKRGRLNALQNLNFAREDHVRSLFRFANGMPLDGDEPTKWLEIHCAKCATDKKSRKGRRQWVGDRRQDIKKIARDPFGTFDRGVLDGKGWRDADSPFAFVAACRELAEAWNDPENFETHLPIGFDGSANGLQHLSLLIGEVESARMVNLLGVFDRADTPNDVYATLIARAIELIGADAHDHAVWWRDAFRVLSPKQQRKLLKQPIMTFAYSVTDEGATLQIAKVYKGFRQNEEPPKGAFRYLAKKVRRVCEQELRGPQEVMDYIQRLAEHRAEQGQFLEWTSPSGFPVANRYQVPNVKRVKCLRDKIRVDYRVADGATHEIRRGKVKHAAAPNFVHSMDAAHLVKVVNAAVSEGITDLLTVHDCFYCLAPQAERFHEIILAELMNLYLNNDPLAELRWLNVIDPDTHPVPRKGPLLTEYVTLGDGTRRMHPLEYLNGADHAFD